MTEQRLDHVLVESDGPVRVVTLNRPEKHNAFDAALHRSMVEVWRMLSHDADARAVVLTGAGRFFSAGGDLDFVAGCAADPEARRHLIREARALAQAIAGFHLPVVAAVNGPAIGVGCNVAVMCDLVYVAESAYLSDPHVAGVGVVAGDGGPAVWPLMMSLLKAKEYLFTGDRIPAQTAVELGLATRSFPDAGLLDASLAMAHRLAELPAHALQDTKAALNLHLHQALHSVMDYALVAERETLAGEDFRRSVKAFRAARTT
jgi:enoyl-CoA hydratase/carnithine racemase